MFIEYEVDKNPPKQQGKIFVFEELFDDYDEFTANTPEELRQLPQYRDLYRTKGPIFQRGDIYVVHIMKIDEDTYGP